MGDRSVSHQLAVNQALRTVVELRRLFDRMGNTTHPRGRILSAYRQARQALAGAHSLYDVQRTLQDLRLAIDAAARLSLLDAVTLGTTQAATELASYALPVVQTGYYPANELQAWLTSFDAQAMQVQAIYLTSGDLTRIIGDGTRVGALSPAPITQQGASWIVGALAAAWGTAVVASLDRAGARSDFVRQAVAAIDERTTDCCLRVHGQTAEINGDFRLTGTPRYADRMRNPPFHYFCRTATCLVRRDEANDAITLRMRDAARAELGARQPDDNRTEIHPAHATSGRG